MFRERGRLVLLGLAQCAGVLASVALLRAMSEELLSSRIIAAAGLALMLAPVLAVASVRVPLSGLLGVTGLALPAAAGIPLRGWPGGLTVIVGTLAFQSLALAKLATLCREARVSFPRCLGLVTAGTLLLLLLRTDWPALPLAWCAVLAAMPAAWERSPRRETLSLNGFWRARGFLFGALGGMTLLVLAVGSPAARDERTIGWGVCLGCLLAAWQRNPWRGPGLVPHAVLLLLVTLVLELFLGGESLLVGGLLGLSLGLGLLPLGTAYLHELAPGWRAAGAALLTGFALMLLGLVGGWTPGPWGNLLLALLFLCAAGVWLLPQWFEQTLEFLGGILARVRLVGPGADRVPLEGPLVLVANHTAYLDPMWICKVIPRKVTAMMTSVFYDVPGIRWLMVHAARAIRVPAATYRREAPELQEAILVLERGGCLLIFPEARLRKTEEKLLYPFGQGLWHILRAVPEARVMTLWVEGAWGSWTSQAGGQPPFRGKPVDLLRKIDIGISTAEPVDACYLEDREAFRHWLMAQVLASRQHLNLPVPTVEQALGQPETTPAEEPHQINAKDEQKT